MDDSYLSISFKVYPISGIEILIAELSLLEFELFEEKPYGLIAYIKSSEYSQNIFEKVRILNSNEFEIEYEVKKIENKNWNEEWEKNYKPVEINKHCIVRAPFHKPSKKTYDIIIIPEMSFGTGHHETTQLMMKYILELNISELMVCDIGCGTGILSILAEMKGAKKIDAVDISKNCCNNTLSNIKLNNCDKIFVHNSNSKYLKENYMI